MTDAKPARSVKVAIIGPGGVGKTRVFKMEYDPTQTESFRKDDFSVDEQKFSLDIMDTAGQEGYSYLSNILREQDGVLMVYSVAEQTTLDDMFRFSEAIKTDEEVFGKLPRVLVANKCDLIRKREVTDEAGRAAARQFGAQYVEASAKSGLNVNYAFEVLIREIQRSPPRRKTLLEPAAKPSSETCSCTLV